MDAVTFGIIAGTVGMVAAAAQFTRFMLNRRQRRRAARQALDVRSQRDHGELLGRTDELEALSEQFSTTSVRAIAVVGSGGVGKTALVDWFVTHGAPKGVRDVLWTSLRLAPTVRDWLADVLLKVSPGRELPQTVDGRIDALLAEMRRRKLVVILDNAETVLEDGAGDTSCLEFEHLLERLIEAEHQSKILVTSRVAPKSAARNALRRSASVLDIGELSSDVAARLFESELKALRVTDDATPPESVKTGNPLLVKLMAWRAAATEGSPAGADPVLSEFSAVLRWHFRRLETKAQHLALQAAAFMDSGSIVDLREQYGGELSDREFHDALDELSRALGLKVDGDTFWIQQVVLEWLVKELLRSVKEEVLRSEPVRLRWVMLYSPLDSMVRRRARRRSLLDRLGADLEREVPAGTSVRSAVESALITCRSSSWVIQGVNAAGNLANMLFTYLPRLDDLDLSEQVLRGVDFGSVELVGCDLSGSQIRACRFRTIHGTVLDMRWNDRMGVLVGVDSLGQLSAWGTKITDGNSTWKVDRTWLRAVTLLGATTDVVVGGDDGVLCCFDLLQRRVRWSATDEGLYWIRALRSSRDGRILATGSEDGVVRLWEPTSRGAEVVSRFPIGGGSVRAIEIEQGGGIVYAGTDDGRVIMCVAGQDPRELVNLGDTKIRGMRLSACGRLLAAFSDSAGLSVITLPGGIVLPAPGAPTTLRSVAWCADDRVLVAAGDDGVVYGWDVPSAPSALPTARPLVALDDRVVALEAEDHRHLSIATEGEHVYRLDVETTSTVERSLGYAQRLWNVSVDPSRTLVVTGGEDRRARVWRLGHRFPTQVANLLHHGRVWSTAFSLDGEVVATACDDNLVRFWSAEDWQLVRESSGHLDWVLDVCAIRTPRGQRFLTTSNDRRVGVWSKHGELVRWLDHHQLRTLRVTSWTEQLAVSSSSDERILIFDPETGNVTDGFELAGHHAWGLAAHYPRREVASGGDNGDVVVSTLVNGKWHHDVIDHHDDQVLGVQYLNDGNAIVAGSFSDDGVRLYKRDGAGWRRSDSPLRLRGRCFAELAGNEFVAVGHDHEVSVLRSDSLTLSHTFRSDLPYQDTRVDGLSGMSDGEILHLLELGATRNTELIAEGESWPAGGDGHA